MSTIYLIPSPIDEEVKETLPAYILSAVKDCQVFFVENERTARRFLKSIWKEMVIDDYEWVLADKSTLRFPATLQAMRSAIQANKNIGIISEAGCPAVADPGQQLVEIGHALGATIKPLVGPSSILLALMGSGMNGQKFCFHGYLPIDNGERAKTIRELEAESAKKDCSQIFMETPYRNSQLLEQLLKFCKPSTRICIAANLSSSNELIQTKRIDQWKKQVPDLHKQPVMFVLYADN